MFFTHMNNWIKNTQSCALCGTPAASHHGLCEDCHADLPWQVAFCQQCALPLPVQYSPGLCSHCQQYPPAFDRTLAAFRYDFPLSQLLPNIKYQRRPEAIGWLGQVLAEYLRLHYEATAWPDALVPVPMHLWNETLRGFNQSRLLADVLSRQLQLPLWHGLQKHRRTPHQADLGLRQRQQNLAHAFRLTHTPPRHPAIIDDVMTTGATANSLAQLLKQAGAQQVDIWVLARTPVVR